MKKPGFNKTMFLDGTCRSARQTREKLQLMASQPHESIFISLLFLGKGIHIGAHWLHVISSHAISTYATSSAAISTKYTFQGLQFQLHAISTLRTSKNQSIKIKASQNKSTQIVKMHNN